MTAVKSKQVTGDWKTVAPVTEEKAETIFSADDVINAFFLGKKKQEDQQKKILSEKFINNLKKAQDIGKEIFKFISSKNIKVEELRLRPKSLTDFYLLYIVQKEKYLSSSFSNIYKKSINEKSKHNSDTFNIDFNFLPHNSKINKEKLVSDGYFLRYAKK